MERDEATSHKIMLCRVIGLLLMADGKVSQDERNFLEQLIRRQKLSPSQRMLVYQGIRDQQDYIHDIETLRCNGFSTELLSELEKAAYADGIFSPEEREMITRVHEIIQYRLGAEQYFLPLERFDDVPLKTHFEVLGMVGMGGFNVVYKARDRRTGALCVIKRLKSNRSDPNDGAKAAVAEDRFWREVSLIEKLKSPNTIRLLGAGFDEGTPYMVLEHLDGISLSKRLREHAMSPRETLHFARQVLESLAEAHSAGIVHRDLKPDNIILCGERQNEVKVLDFGLAGIIDTSQNTQQFKINSPHQVVGTPSYMAPEQISEGETPRQESDIYSLGLILSECLTGERVFPGRRPQEIIRAQLSETLAPIPEDVLSGSLGEVISCACHKKWMRRFGPSPEGLQMMEEKRQSGDKVETHALHRALYQLNSPADEMLKALNRVQLGFGMKRDRPQSGLIRFFSQVFKRTPS